MNGQGHDYDEFLRGLPEDEDLTPTIEELWRDSPVIDFGPSIEAVEAEIFAKIREIRHEYGFMAYVDIYVYVAECSACTYMACRGMEVPMPLPEVFGANWPRCYATLGISISEIKATQRGIKEGWRGVGCRTCGEIMPLQHDINFYVVKEHLSQYFYLDEGRVQFGGVQGQRIEKRKRIRKKMKEKLLQFSGCECAGCHRTLQPDEVTMDHIIAVARGGPTQLLIAILESL
jgi:hypothetical protein